MPKILAFWLEGGRQRLWARCSEMNEADEALSRIALTSIDEPLGALTKTWQVMSRESDLNAMAVLETTGFSGVLVGGRMGGVSPWFSMWSKVWCGFWQFLHLWRVLHCLTMCPDPKKLMHKSFILSVATFLSCDFDLNLVPAYKGCLSVLQVRRMLVFDWQQTSLPNQPQKSQRLELEYLIN